MNKLFLKSVLDVIFPPLCCICDTFLTAGQESGLCPHCLSQIKYIDKPHCTRCGKPFYSEVITDHLCGGCLSGEKYFSRARAVGYYDGILRKAIHLLKYKSRINLALPLGNLIAMRMQSFLSESTYQVIIPVPLHHTRLRERGFNQVLSFARSIGTKFGIHVDAFTLMRSRQTKPQVGLAEEERLNNVRGAFTLVKGRGVKDKTILLVDDVYTSGNTVTECSKVLINAGAHKVDVVTLARVS